MINRVEGTRNGFYINNTSTKKDWEEITSLYEKVRCVICNSKTSSLCFGVPLLGNSIITINNKIDDMTVYINGVF